MTVDEIYLKNYRNYGNCCFSFHKNVNIIHGRNAQGKTNLLEAIFYLSCARSFRHVRDSDLITLSADVAGIEAELFDAGEAPIAMKISLPRSGRRQIIINGVKQKRVADIIGRVRAVLFVPGDLNLIREGASVRRRMMDTALMQLRPRYYTILSEYNKILEHKQHILRGFENKPSLLYTMPEFNRKLADMGAHIIRYRAMFARGLSKKAAAVHEEISGGREYLEVSYETTSCIDDPFSPSAHISELLYGRLCELEKAELSARACLTGPHKDDLAIEINNLPARRYASQGQMRTAALSLKIAEREMFYEDSGEYPLLLLDDVLSELDFERRDFVLNRIRGGQVFITCCETGSELEILSGKRFEIENGQIKEESEF